MSRVPATLDASITSLVGSAIFVGIENVASASYAGCKHNESRRFRHFLLE